MIDIKRIIIIIFSILLVIGILYVFYYFMIKGREVPMAEIIPQEEISEEQMRQTIVTLYFKSGNQLISEERIIDVKELINNPYDKILNLLIDGPKENNIEKTIPEGTKINNIKKENDILLIDFSSEFLENHTGGEENEKLTIKSIVNTLTELTEINGVKILINGEENKGFNDNFIKFNKIYSKENII